MKKLELQNFGVLEMNNDELMSVDGGSFWRFLAGIGAVVACVGAMIGSLPLVIGGVVAVALWAAIEGFEDVYG